MGNANSFQNERFSRNFERNFFFAREINDSRFGDIQLYKAREHEEIYIMVKSLWLNNSETLSELLLFNKNIIFLNKNNEKVIKLKNEANLIIQI